MTMRILYSLASIIVLIAPNHEAAKSGSYWVVYEGNAPESCLKPDGEMVDDTCCTDVGPQFGLIADSFNSNCFIISGLLGPNGGSLMSYLGCDAGVPLYGEACYNAGENGGIIPANTTSVVDRNATDIGDCGCTFQVAGNGCQVIRDFSSLPGFESDTRQVFLYMMEECETEDDVTSDSSPTDSSTETTPSAAAPALKLLGSILIVMSTVGLLSLA